MCIKNSKEAEIRAIFFIFDRASIPNGLGNIASHFMLGTQSNKNDKDSSVKTHYMPNIIHTYILIFFLFFSSYICLKTL